jgi:hypothetical protein
VVLAGFLGGSLCAVIPLATTYAFELQPRGYIEKWSYDQLMLALLKNFREAELEAFVAEGAAWSEDHAVEEALLL